MRSVSAGLELVDQKVKHRLESKSARMIQRRGLGRPLQGPYSAPETKAKLGRRAGAPLPTPAGPAPTRAASVRLRWPVAPGRREPSLATGRRGPLLLLTRCSRSAGPARRVAPRSARRVAPRLPVSRRGLSEVPRQGLIRAHLLSHSPGGQSPRPRCHTGTCPRALPQRRWPVAGGVLGFAPTRHPGLSTLARRSPVSMSVSHLPRGDLILTNPTCEDPVSK